tara:strand:+ start:263 stop:1666 length:1404 start_codon:yes stop_codon:yes gene_type:complete
MELREHQIDILGKTKKNKKGIIQSPTGSGKTITFIEDSKRFLSSGNVIVVIAPQLMLCQQLFLEFDKHLKDYQFVHLQVSSERDTFRRSIFAKVQPKKPTTKIEDITNAYRIAEEQGLPLVIFSTYKSLNRVYESEIPIKTVYYDEAHHAVDNGNFNTIVNIGCRAEYSYFFTATPRYMNPRNSNGRGMENKSVYGEIIAEVRFDYLVKKGYILRPKLHLQRSLTETENTLQEQVDFDAIKETVEYHEKEYKNHDALKILFCMSGTLSIKNLLEKTEFQEWANNRGYNVLSIDSENGGYHDGEIMNRSKFIERIQKIGDDPTSKMLVLHYEMISEGIDIPGFSGVSFMRKSFNSTFYTQTIGRVIRTAGDWKKYGLVTIVEHEHDTNEVSEFTQTLVRSLLEHGVPLESVIFDIDGRAKGEETVDDIDDEILKKLKNIEINWNHSNLLQEIEDEIQNQENKFIERVF